MPYDLYPAVDENYNFAQEVRVALHKSVELRNTVDPMTTVLRNNLTAAEKWDGRVIANTDTDLIERWDAGTSQWYPLLDAAAGDARYVKLTSDQTVAGIKTFSSSPVLPGNATTALQAVPKQQLDAAIPVGMIGPWAGTGAPTGWLTCDGTAVSRTTYAALFAVCSTAYGVGDGSTTFNLPDLRGRMPVCFGAGSFGSARGTKLGAESVAISQAEMPLHAHIAKDHIHQADTRDYDFGSNPQAGGDKFTMGATVTTLRSPGWSTWGSGDWWTYDTGGNGAHNNIQPSMILQYIIKFQGDEFMTNGTDNWLTQAIIADDPYMRLRVAQSAAKNGCAQDRGINPDEWSHDWRRIWAAAPGWYQAWDSAKAAGRTDIGAQSDVITDGMIDSQVQAMMPFTLVSDHAPLPSLPRAEDLLPKPPDNTFRGPAILPGPGPAMPPVPPQDVSDAGS